MVVMCHKLKVLQHMTNILVWEVRLAEWPNVCSQFEIQNKTGSFLDRKSEGHYNFPKLFQESFSYVRYFVPKIMIWAFSVCFLFYGPHLAVLRSHLWFCTQKSILTRFRGWCAVLGSTPDWPHARQAPYILYYLSGPNHFYSVGSFTLCSQMLI